MATWFSASSVLIPLSAAFGIAPQNRGLITAAVQLGFVAGAMGSATVALADAVEARTLIRIGIAIAAAANAGILFVHGFGALCALRFATGFGLALVYPPSVRLLSLWFARDRGLALGIIIGALTVGSFSPHLLSGTQLPWRSVIYGASLLAFAALPLMWAVPHTPHAQHANRFDFRTALRVLQNRSVLLADAGYWGHMWELYAVWAWAPIFYAASLQRANVTVSAGAVAFAAFGLFGAAGCVIAGALADRFGRANVAAAAMAVSGAISFSIGSRLASTFLWVWTIPFGSDVVPDVNTI